ncbi:MAG: transcription elongation factor GreA [Planctomycetes bacterium]|nr:transcription elongation factor GreA [Planctomycetota bacterium]
MERLPITPEGFEKLRAKLKYLEEEVRSAVEKRLGEARELGDLSENSEFDSAREEMWRVDRQIAELRDRLSRAEIINLAKRKADGIAFGSKVKMRNIDSGDILEYTLVGEGEADPSEGFISIMTPVGKALLGHKAGEKVDIKVPAGTLHYEIISIE